MLVRPVRSVFFTLWPGKTRTHCGGNIVSFDVSRVAKRAATLLRSAWTQQMFLKFFRNIFCVRNKCFARGKTGQHLGNMRALAMLPPQCVLVLPGL